MTRKQFLRSALGVSAGILGLTILTSCDDDDTIDTGDDGNGGGGGGGGGGNETPPDAPPTTASRCLRNGTSTAIATNHGHVLVVSKEDVAAGVDKSYNIMGSADHPHTVTITRAHFQSLAADAAIMTESSLNGSATFGTHSHGIMVACTGT
jgi:hypothetical protein